MTHASSPTHHGKRTGRVGSRLLTAFALAVLLPLGALAVGLWLALPALLQQAGRDRLTAVTALQAEQLTQHFAGLRKELGLLVHDPTIVDACRQLTRSLATLPTDAGVDEIALGNLRREVRDYYSERFAADYRAVNGGASPALEGFAALNDPIAVLLQHQYLAAIEEPGGAGKVLSETTYSRLHRAYHPRLRAYVRHLPFENLLLVDVASGRVIYAVEKSIELGTAFTDGPLADSGAAHAFQEAVTADAPGYQALADYAPYLPALGQPAAFLAAPIYDDTRKIAIAIVQLSAKSLGDGLAASSRSYALGRDGQLRTSPGPAAETARDVAPSGAPTATVPGLGAADATVAATTAATPAGCVPIRHADGSTWLTAWNTVVVHPPDPFRPDGLRWVVVSELADTVLTAPLARWRQQLALVTGAALLLALGLAYWIIQPLRRQCQAIVTTCQEIERGNFAARTPIVTRDELGAVAGTLNQLTADTLSLVQTREERDAVQQSVEQLCEHLAEVATGDLTVTAALAEPNTQRLAEAVNATVGQLRELVRQVKAAAETAAEKAEAAERQVDRLGSESQGQATAITQSAEAGHALAGNLKRLAEQGVQGAESAQLARQAAQSGTKAAQDATAAIDSLRAGTQAAAKRIKRLGESSQQIGEIVQMIRDLADRTNVLALNAAIRVGSDRAHDQAFVGIAEEIERLSTRCQQSAREVAALVRVIQSETAEAVAAMEGCSQQVVEGSQKVRRAEQELHTLEQHAETQSALSQRLRQLLQDHSHATETSAQNLAEVAKATRGRARSATKAAEDIADLAQRIRALHAQTTRFRVSDDDLWATVPMEPRAPEDRTPRSDPPRHRLDETLPVGPLSRLDAE